jgi:dihydroorotase/N-acyl-D-amino-acid deacylase
MMNWGKDIHRAIELIEDARREGLDVTCDFYPYDGGSTALTTMLPPAFIKGDLQGALKRLGTKEGIEEFRTLSRVRYPDWDNFCVTLGWDRILISGVNRKENEKFLGKRVTEAVKEFGFEDAEELAAHLMYSENGKTAIINMSMHQDDIDTVARLPYSNIVSDAIYAKTDTPHPRMFGAFPKIIREYVNERHLLTLEEAIHKMTSSPADKLGLKDRGRILPGVFADVIVFGLDTFVDHATYTDSARLATGLDYSIINGKIAIDHDMLTGNKAGKNIRV